MTERPKLIPWSNDPSESGREKSRAAFRVPGEVSRKEVTMFIIEGPDGSGKTTLAKKIAAGFGVQIFHAGGPPESHDELLSRVQFQYERFGSILDRASIITERVYGPIIRGKSVFTLDEYETWIKAYAEKGWMMIYCRPPTEVLLQYVKNEMDRVICDEGKFYKNAIHFTRVRANMPSIVLAYDRFVSRSMNLGMEVINYVRNQYPI
jgi:hypothetical protein